MEDKLFNNQKVKKKYLKYLSSQEVMSEPFRDKLGQLNKFYLPISKMIKDEYNKKKTVVIGLTGGQELEVNNFKYFKNYFKRGLQFRNSYIFN